MAPWSFGIEWDTELGNYSQRQKQAFMLDHILDMANENNVYIMLTLIPHGEFSSKTNPEWDKNPYNTKNDGIIDRPEDFFTNPAARKAFKNRLHYIIARWGYSNRIMAWELFNEVDLTENYSPSAVADWHSEMFDFIKSHDTYRHLLTTSFSNPNRDPEVWNLSQVDIIQTHIYNLHDEAEQIYEACKQKIDNYAKPHIVGEYGIETGNDFINNGVDKLGIHMHNAMWAGAFTLSLGAPMQWYWWDYTDKYNLYQLFRPLNEFTKNINWGKESFNDLLSRDVFYKIPVQGTQGGAVKIFPVDIWEKASKDEFMIKSDGVVTNKSYFNAFLFGKSKPQMRTSPVITVRNETPLKLVIKINRVSDDNILRVSINNSQVMAVSVCARDFGSKKYMEQYKIFQADVETEYSVNVPEGDNDITIENTGKDWMRIESITIENFLSPSLAPVFVSGVQGKSSAYIWLKNRNYGYKNPDAGPVAESYMEIGGFLPGRYVIEYFDTYDGKFTDKKDYIVDTDTLRLDIPELKTDMAVRITKFKK
jgi:hypothetical protein